MFETKRTQKYGPQQSDIKVAYYEAKKTKRVGRLPKWVVCFFN